MRPDLFGCPGMPIFFTTCGLVLHASNPGSIWPPPSGSVCPPPDSMT